MPDAAPGWAREAPLGAARWRLACITRRGVGMTLAAAVFWLAMGLIAAFAGQSSGRIGLFLVVGGAVVYPAGFLLNRVLGGDLTARGSELRGLVGAISLGQLLGWPLIIALLIRDVHLVAFAMAALLGAHFLPYGWLYRAPAYYALGIACVVAGTALQALVPRHANVAIPLAMALFYALAGVEVLRRNRREGMAC